MTTMLVVETIPLFYKPIITIYTQNVPCFRIMWHFYGDLYPWIVGFKP